MRMCTAYTDVAWLKSSSRHPASWNMYNTCQSPHFIMDAPTVCLVLVVVLGYTTSTLGSTMGHVQGNTQEGTANFTTVNNQCSSLQRRQDLLDNRINERDARVNNLDARLSSHMNEVNTRLNTQQNGFEARFSEVNTRLNRMDSHFDELEMAITGMKEYLLKETETMGHKVELALSGPHGQKDRLGYLLQPRSSPSDFRPPRVPQVHQGCQEALSNGWTSSGVYSIRVDQDKVIDVYCEQRLSGGGWTVFQVRKDGSVNFYRNWDAYKSGFGELTGEFWLGNDNIHLLTKDHDQELKIELTSPEGEVEFADYSNFWIEGEAEKYKLNVSGYAGSSPPGDSLAYHNGMPFSTKDSGRNCAKTHQGAWWYKSCHHSNLNGVYGGLHNKGMRWRHWKGSLSMKATRMMVRKLS